MKDLKTMIHRKRALLVQDLHQDFGFYHKIKNT